MLVVPFVAGAILCWREDLLPAYVAPMFATWMLGYFAFHAASGALKAPASRRARWFPALAVYGLASLAAGLITLFETGAGALWWLAVFAVPLGVALWLASRRNERALAGGLLTVLLASLMVLVVRFPDPTTMLGDPDFGPAAVVAAAMFGYFGGTVFHVKAMIRKRGQLAWRNLSIGWHAAWTIAGAGLTVAGLVDRWWPVFFLVTTVRAWLLPVLAERRPVRPLMLGIAEVVLSATLLLIVGW
jgi:hypothetical protein